MKKLFFILGLGFCLCFPMHAQTVAIKTNVLSDATTTPSLAVEGAFLPHWSAELEGSYNGWNLSGGKSLKHWKVQPELRYWIHERFNGHYFGVHALYLDYDFAGIKWLYGMKKDHRYDGNGYGAGVSYGYQLYLSPRWNLEFTAGAGYVHMEYDKYPFSDRKNKTGKFKNEYWGLTKAGISIVYILK